MRQLQALLPLILMFALLYFLLIRPQQRQQKNRKAMLAALNVGDKVITIGGIYGTITNIREDRIFLQIAENVEIRVTRSAIGQLQAEAASQKQEEKK